MSPSPKDPPAAGEAGSAIENEFSQEERGLLLKLAHDALASAFAFRELSPDLPSAHLAESRGVFTTLYVKGALRGCVGYALAVTSLYRGIIETARAAAFDDPRFAPMSAEELPEVKVSLSVLSPLRPIAADEVVVGVHGLLVTMGVRRGLLLPQVPVEHGWDRIMFLEQTCRKAGLPNDAWKKGAILEAFTAEVFGED